jgi:outer membrane immunogenic protein
MRNSVAFGLFILGSAAQAADLPSLPVATAPAPVPVFTWTGFYGGLAAGAGFNTTRDRTVFVPPEAFPPPPAAEPEPPPPAPTPVVTPPVVTPPPPRPRPPRPPRIPPAGDPFLDFIEDDEAGFVFGGQIGYNWQFGVILVGVEADIQSADIGGATVTRVRPEVIGFTPRQRRTEVDWFGTVRGRAGVTFDRFLIYGTGGFAYGGTDNGGDLFRDGDDTSTGWTAGGGIEWALPLTSAWFGASAVTLGVEGLFVSLKNESTEFIGTFADQPVFFQGTDRDDTEFTVVRAKLNFKF